jgi:Amino acid synthesis
VIRRLVTRVEEIRAEPGAGACPAVRRVAAAAVIRNPWLGRGRIDDLAPAVEQIAPRLAVALTGRVLDALGGAGAIEAFGKAAIVGTDGEIEHGAALIHTPWFGDIVREAFAGTSIIVFSDTRGAAGTPLVVPIWHTTAAATRTHYQTVEIAIADAPRPDEIVVVCAAADGGRPLARIGDRTTDTATVRLEDHRP